MEHFKRVETALYEETGFQEECTPAQVASALLSLDPELSEKQVRAAPVLGGEPVRSRSLEGGCTGAARKEVIAMNDRTRTGATSPTCHMQPHLRPSFVSYIRVATSTPLTYAAPCRQRRWRRRPFRAAPRWAPSSPSCGACSAARTRASRSAARPRGCRPSAKRRALSSGRRRVSRLNPCETGTCCRLAGDARGDSSSMVVCSKSVQFQPPTACA